MELGLFINARYDETAQSLQPMMTEAFSISLLALFVLMLLLNISSVLGAVGSGTIAAAVLLIVLSFGMGYFLSGSSSDLRSVMGLGIAQRNVSTALVIASSNFADPNVLVMILVGALLMLVA